MSVRGPNNVGRAVQTDPTLLRYASTITGQKKCWELLVNNQCCVRLHAALVSSNSVCNHTRV